MTIDDLIQFYGVPSDAELAKKINRGRTTVYYRRNKGMSPKTQAFFEVLTNGKLKADLQNRNKAITV